MCAAVPSFSISLTAILNRDPRVCASTMCNGSAVVLIWPRPYAQVIFYSLAVSIIIACQEQLDLPSSVVYSLALTFPFRNSRTLPSLRCRIFCSATSSSCCWCVFPLSHSVWSVWDSLGSSFFAVEITESQLLFGAEQKLETGIMNIEFAFTVCIVQGTEPVMPDSLLMRKQQLITCPWISPSTKNLLSKQMVCLGRISFFFSGYCNTGAINCGFSPVPVHQPPPNDVSFSRRLRHCADVQ